MKLLLWLFVALALAVTLVTAEPEADPLFGRLLRGGRWGRRGRWGGRRFGGRWGGRRSWGRRRRWGRSAEDESEAEDDMEMVGEEKAEESEDQKVLALNPYMMYNTLPYYAGYNALPYTTVAAAPVKSWGYNTITPYHTMPVASAAYHYAPLTYAAPITHSVAKREAEPEPLFGLIARALRRKSRGWGRSWGGRRSWRSRGWGPSRRSFRRRGWW